MPPRAPRPSAQTPSEPQPEPDAGSGPGPGSGSGRAYHHPDLRTAILEASFEVLAESGPAAFSVAQVARRLAVSSAAPYRHFRDRDTLLAAVATTAARDLAERMRQDVDQAGPDPADRLAVTAGTYVRFALSRGAGFNVIFAAGLEKLHDEALAEAGRDLISLLFDLGEKATGRTKPEAMALLEAHIAGAHGYATLYQDGFFARLGLSVDEIAARAVHTSHELIRAATLP